MTRRLPPACPPWVRAPGRGGTLERSPSWLVALVVLLALARPFRESARLLRGQFHGDCHRGNIQPRCGFSTNTDVVVLGGLQRPPSVYTRVFWRAHYWRSWRRPLKGNRQAGWRRSAAGNSFFRRSQRKIGKHNSDGGIPYCGIPPKIMAARCGRLAAAPQQSCRKVGKAVVSDATSSQPDNGGGAGDVCHVAAAAV